MPEVEKLFIVYPAAKPWTALWKWFGWVFACSTLFGSGVAFHGWTYHHMVQQTPFLQVTNRDISLFLWQNPSLMRTWAKSKQNYLPAFEAGETIGLKAEYAEDYAQAPPEVLFLYHTWQRLIGAEWPKRVIPGAQFATFLQDVPEWQPHFWQKAPPAYIAFVQTLEERREYDFDDIPWEVYRAFSGWKNYFLEGEAINALVCTKREVETFLIHYPHYSPSYWQNIAGTSYLQSLSLLAPEELVPAHEIPSFLRVALYNHAKEHEFQSICSKSISVSS